MPPLLGIVVGGGLAGCAVGWGLALRERGVLVLERGEQLGPEASSQNDQHSRRNRHTRVVPDESSESGSWMSSHSEEESDKGGLEISSQGELSESRQDMLGPKELETDT